MLEIIVDSTCDLSEELMEEYDISFIPHRIYLKDTEYIDRININAEEVYEAMKIGIIPLTSIPSPLELLGRFSRSCEREMDFIFLSVSARLSGTYSLAASLLEELDTQYPSIRKAVVDTKSSSTAIGLIAIQAVKLSRAGADFDTIVGNVIEMSNHTEHIFMVQDPSWLIRGGRLLKAQGFAGKILNIKPILHVRDGAVELLEKIRGRRKALLAIADIAEERLKAFPNQTIGISHSDDFATAAELAEILKLRLGERDILINSIGATLTSHLGVGGVGVFFFNSRPELYME